MAVVGEILDLKKGNHKTFELLFKKYYVFLCYEARSYITEKYIIEEVVGDVFRWLWENRETLVITSVRAYLVRAVIMRACHTLGKINLNMWSWMILL